MDSPIAERRTRLRNHESPVLSQGTPVYAFFEADLRRNYRALRDALDEHYPDSRIHFAVKSNFNLGVLSVLADAGCGAEAFSGCELSATLRAGFDADDVLLTGLNRDRSGVERALETGVRRFLVDNAAELERVTDAAAATDTTPRVLLRGNPAMAVPTHPEIATATRESKFGLDIASGRAMAVARDVVGDDRVELAGVQLHIGSQVTATDPYAVATRAMLEFAADIRDELGVEPEILDMGGGFPVPYDETVPDAVDIVATIADVVETLCDERDMDRPRLFLEPGRRLVGNAGTLLATVGAIKETPHSTFAVLDAGTNTVSSYWPYPIYALDDDEATEQYDIAGPLCYTGDVIQEDVQLPALESGDVLAIDRVGAYSLGSASHTNAMPKPPVVLVRTDGTVDLVRPREDCDDVLTGQVPPDLR